MLAIREEGAGDPLVLVHGAGTSSAIWHRVTAHLASEYRVLAPDLPGYGGSPAAGPGFALDEVADGLVAGLEAAGVPAPYDLVGHSMGGAIAILAVHGAIGTPVRRTAELDLLIAELGIRHLAVSRPGFGRSDPCPGRRIADFPADVEHLADRLGLARFAAAAAEGVQGMVEDYVTCCTAWGFDLREVLGEVHLWHGERDRFVPVEHARALAAALPRCRARFDAEDGHFFFRRRVAEVLCALVAAAQPPKARAAAATISS
ncbi:MAG TPA: alpha/beta fold hydrolase [Solirubrobacteraceae bacterium]